MCYLITVVTIKLESNLQVHHNRMHPHSGIQSDSGCHSKNLNLYRPVVELPVWPCCLPPPILHSQSHLLQVAGISVYKGRVHGFIFIRGGLWLRSCLTQTSSCVTIRVWSAFMTADRKFKAF